MIHPDWMMEKYAIHGMAVELSGHVESLRGPVRQTLSPFLVDAWPEGFNPVRGSIRPFVEKDVLRQISPYATPVAWTDPLVELYEAGDEFWIVDERWGMAEINLLRNEWTSWVLPNPTIDPIRVAEMAILGPMAQLLRSRGLYLLPAMSVVRGGKGMLIVSPFAMEPELRALIGAGYQVIGQRWTALRDDGGRLSLLQIPGYVERPATRRIGTRGQVPVESPWIDLLLEHPLAGAHHAYCNTVLVVVSGRRPIAQSRQLTPSPALNILRKGWPIAELQPHRRHGQLAGRLATTCRVFEVQLSRDPEDLVSVLDDVRSPGPRITAPATPAPTVTLSLPTNALSTHLPRKMAG